MLLFILSCWSKLTCGAFLSSARMSLSCVALRFTPLRMKVAANEMAALTLRFRLLFFGGVHVVH